MNAYNLSFGFDHSTGAGLSDRECYMLAKAAPDLPGTWHVKYDEDDLGHGSIALIPGGDNHDDEAPVFLIWRESRHLHLGLGQGDFYAGLGTHADVEALVEVVRHTLEGVRAIARWVDCELGSTTWKNGSVPTVPEQSRRLN